MMQKIFKFVDRNLGTTVSAATIILIVVSFIGLFYSIYNRYIGDNAIDINNVSPVKYTQPYTIVTVDGCRYIKFSGVFNDSYVLKDCDEKH